MMTSTVEYSMPDATMTNKTTSTAQESPVDDVLLVTLTKYTSIFLGVFGAVGCLANVLNLIVFRAMGFKDSINISLFGLSLSDFATCFIAILYATTISPEIVSRLENAFPVDIIGLSVVTIMHPYIISGKISVIINAYIAFERCLCIALPIKVKCLITPTRTKYIITIVFLIIIFSHAHVVYMYPLGWVFDPARNISVIGIDYRAGWKEIRHVFLTVQIFVNYTGPYVFVTICTAILVANLIAKSNWRKMATATKSDNSGENSNSNNRLTSIKDRKVSKMVLGVSILFIVCTIPALWVSASLVWLDISPSGSNYRLFIILHLAGFITGVINAASNIVIYYNSSSKYHSTFHQTFLCGNSHPKLVSY